MGRILQLRIGLKRISPEIWRRFLVDESVSFGELHEIIQAVMGWKNYHLYEFRIGEAVIEADDEHCNAGESGLNKLHSTLEFLKTHEQQGLNKGSGKLDIAAINKLLTEAEKNQPHSRFDIYSKISGLLNAEGLEFTYRYDFGDCWEHALIVEKVMQKSNKAQVPCCLAGKRACPPEDCGGSHGYEELVKIKKNKRDPQYNERIVEWLGEGHDFEMFDIDKVNMKLKRFAKKARKTRKARN